MKATKWHFWKWSRLMMAVFLLGSLSGCWKPAVHTESVAEPPLIPAPPSAEEVANAVPAMDVQAYADLLELENDRRYPPGLVEAVTHAIQLGVLKPTNLQERFEPDRPLTYGEFRQWALAYQTALYGYQALPSAEALAEAKLPSTNVKPDLTGPMSPEKLFILPEKLDAGSQVIQPNQALSREALCHLYFLLTKQQARLRNLSLADIEGAFPNTQGNGAEESLSQFKDYTVISPWARPSVAMFYQSGQLQQLFRQTISQLTIDDGFGPKKPVNRAEAIVLLHWVYGKITPTVSQDTNAKPQDSGVIEPHAKLRLPNNTAPNTQPAIPPSPMGRWKMFEEKNPQGTRRSVEINTPD